jgi:hypothetical protein
LGELNEVFVDASGSMGENFQLESPVISISVAGGVSQTAVTPNFDFVGFRGESIPESIVNSDPPGVKFY